VTLAKSGVPVTVDQVLNAKDSPARPDRSQHTPSIGTESDTTDGGQSVAKQTVEQQEVATEEPVIENDLMVRSSISLISTN
jgi:hypothetical protein